MKKSALLFSIFIIIAGCTGNSENLKEKQKPLVVVSLYPLYDFAKNVAGDKADVLILVPPGLNSHLYEPTPMDIILLQKADILFLNGAGFETWAPKTIEGLQNQNLLIVDSSKHITLERVLNGSTILIDPHLWLSPKNAMIQVKLIADALIQKDPENKNYYLQNAEKYIQELSKLDSRLTKTLSTCKKREMFVSHAAFGYFARDYGLRQIPIIPYFEPVGEVSLRDIELLVRAAKEYNATHIFFEEFISPKASEVIAKEINGHTAVFSPMEAYRKEDIDLGNGYLYYMDKNRETLAQALGCS
ncbi:MAG: zinc ABC transporter substrate-binding protein [Candidatus Anstonellales archaeon]